MRQWFRYLGCILMGGAAGAAFAYLTAPASGAESRRRLGRRLEDEAEELRRKGVRAARHAADYVEDQIKEGKKKLSEVVSRS
jgi:gas vesicle protein